MSLFVVDVEHDGPMPPDYSMVCFGVVKIDKSLDKTFYGQVKPISDNWNEQALSISGFNRDQHLKFDEPEMVMSMFADWLQKNSNGRPVFISDNNGSDFLWINYYFHKYYGSNPFGWSSRRIGDLYCGMQNNMYAKWKHLRSTKHTHNPVDDAKGNAEALLKMYDMGLKFKLK
ncbi:MAG: exonuclease [bacterium]